MPFASGAEVRVAYVAEATFGTVPATPAFKTVRATNGGLRTTKATGTSDERRADRNVSDEYMLGKDSAGSYDFELSYGTFDDFFEAALGGTWTTNVLKNGVTKKSFTIEETIELGATDAFSRFRGAMVNGFTLDITAREAITGSMDIMAVEEQLATAIVTGATYAAATTSPVLTASAHVGTVTFGAFASPKIRRISLDVTNNLRTRPTIGTLFSQEFGTGRFDVTGTIECYFEDQAIYTAVMNHDTAAISVTVGATTANKYTILIPKAQLGDGDRVIGGTDDDIMVAIPFRGVFDTATAASLQITRAVA